MCCSRAAADDSPIGTYLERLVQVGRVFDLYRDRVVVTARWWWGRPIVTTVWLASLKPEYEFQFIRYRLLKHGILVAAIGVAVALVLGSADGNLVQQAARAVGWGLAALGLMTSVMTYQRVVFARFSPRSGRGGLDIARSGPDRGRFEEFLKLIQRQIRNQTKS